MARKILLADDSVTAQNMGRKILTDAGYEVLTVNNGSAALKRVSEQKPELIVLDVYMPGYSGLEVCQRLKDAKETSRIPVLLTVGKLEPFKPEDARRVGADAYIIKPFEASELLSALTRLEDRIVPQGDGSRFATTVSGIERFVTDPTVKRQEPGDGGEQGWKSRIRFPSKKAKKEEPEPEPDYATPTSFRELRGGPTKKEPEATSPVESRPERQEPGLVPDIPHDITPHELDALSALVAKLDGPIPEAEEIAPIGDKIGRGGPAPETAAEVPVPGSSEAAAATQGVEPSGSREEAPSAQTVPAVEADSAVGAEGAASGAEPRASEPEYTSAPIDKDDEPFFATAAAAVPQPSIEAQASGAEQSAASASEQTGSDASVPEPASAAATESQQAIVKEVDEGENKSKVEEMLAEAVAEEVVAEQPLVSEDRVPTDEELAEALKLLTPVNDSVSQEVHAAASIQQTESVPAPENSTSAQAEKAGNGSRWVAETVELTPAEMSVSLEAEMFRSLAPPSLPAQAPGAAAAIEIPEAAGVADAANVADGPLVLQPTMPEIAAVSEPGTVQTPGAEPTPQAQVFEEIAGPPPEEAVSTLASQDAVMASDGQSSIESGNEIVSEDVDATSAAPAVHEDATGDQQSMSKHVKTDQSKGSKSGWHQIRTAAPAAKSDIEAAKHAEGEPPGEEIPKAMAAAAASDDTSSSAAPDSNAIASIVDSVLADLRPRIVEEIAKKLAKK